MNFLPSPQKVASVYQGNPAPLQQKVQQAGQQPNGLPNDLMDALALQMVVQQQQAAKAAMQQAQPQAQGTVVDQLKQAATANAKGEVAQKISTLQHLAQQQQSQPQAPQPQAGGIDQLQSNIGLAGGGIVAFDGTDGSQVQGDDTQDAPPTQDAAQSQAAFDLLNAIAEEKRKGIRDAARRGQEGREQTGVEGDRAGLDGYLTLPREEYRAAQETRAHYPETVRYGHEGGVRTGTYAPNADSANGRAPAPNQVSADAGIPAALPSAAPDVPDAPGRSGPKRGGSPTAYKSDTDTGAPTPAVNNGIATPGVGGSGSISIRRPAAGTPKAPAGMFSKPDMDSFTVDEQNAIRKQMGIDPDAEQAKGADYFRKTVNADPTLEAMRQRAMAEDAMRHKGDALRSPLDEWLTSIVNRDRTRGGGWEAAGAAGAQGLTAAQKQWQNEDVNNLTSLNSALNGIDNTGLKVNEETAKAGAAARAEGIKAVSAGITAGATESTRIESAKQRLQGAQDAAAARLLAVQERLAMTASTDKATRAAEIRAAATDMHTLIAGIEGEINKVDPAMATVNPDIRARLGTLQGQLDTARSHLAKLHGIDIGVAPPSPNAGQGSKIKVLGKE